MVLMPQEKYGPRYSGPNRSGICVCGHSWEVHHLGVIMNEAYAKATLEAYLPEECEAHGFNESGGLGTDGLVHCMNYKDSKEEDSNGPG
jgi:hypothetical protein